MDSETYKKLEYILSGSGVTEREKKKIVDLFEEYASQFKVEADSREWISVEERLPEINEIVQFWRNGWIVGKRVDVGGTTLWHYKGDSLYTYNAPSHWQPLPSPPLTVPDKQK